MRTAKFGDLLSYAVVTEGSGAFHMEEPGTGEVQVEERVAPLNPGADGATGWHAIDSTVV